MSLRIIDIAKLANVSPSAVSIALNNKPGISQETRDKILNIVEEKGYVHKPNSKSTPVSQNNNKVVNFVACTNPGIVIDKFENLPFFTELIRHIGECLSSRGYSLMISSINLDNVAEEIKQFTSEENCNGIILLGTDLTKEQITFFAEHQPNIVVVDTCFETLNVDFVNMNSVLGAYQAANHLIELGHKRIGYAESTVRIQNFELRKKGFLTALHQKGFVLSDRDHFPMLPTLLTSQEKLKEELQQRRNDLPTAIFCESDYIAISLLKSFKEIGIKVPEEISIIGFDDIQETKITSPELSSIHVPKKEMALLATDRIIALMEGHAKSKMKMIVDTNIKERGSSRPHSQ